MRIVSRFVLVMIVVSSLFMGCSGFDDEKGSGEGGTYSAGMPQGSE